MPGSHSQARCLHLPPRACQRRSPRCAPWLPRLLPRRAAPSTGHYAFIRESDSQGCLYVDFDTEGIFFQNPCKQANNAIFYKRVLSSTATEDTIQ